MLLGLPAWTWALIGLLVGGIATGGLIALERHNLRAQAHLQLRQVAKRGLDRVEREFDNSGGLLRAMQSAYFVAGDMDQQRFATVLENVSPRALVPSMVAMAFAPRSDSGDASGHARYIYQRVAPMAGNAAVLGLDVAEQPVNLRALERARDIDRPVMSAAFHLHQPASDRSDSLGIVIRLPVFATGAKPASVAERRQREIGALGLSIRVKPLLGGILSAEGLQRFHVRVYDVTDTTSRKIFDSGATTPALGEHYGGTIIFGERRWRLDLQPRGRGYDASVLWMIGIGGALGSLLLASLFWSSRAARRADSPRSRWSAGWRTRAGAQWGSAGK